MSRLTESILNNFDVMREKAFTEAEPSIDTDTLTVTSDIDTEPKSRDRLNNLFAWISDHASEDDLNLFLDKCGIDQDQFEDPDKIADDKIDNIEFEAKNWVGDHIADEDILGLADQGIDLESENLIESVDEYIRWFRKAVKATDTRNYKRLLNSAMSKLRDADSDLYNKALGLISRDDAAIAILNMLKKKASSGLNEDDAQITYGEVDPEENEWVNNFHSKTCPHCNSNEGLDLFWTSEDHSWAESVCSVCGEIVDPYIEVDNGLDDKSNEESFTMYNNDSDKTVNVYKGDDGKWHDSDGNKYMGYLSKADVKSYFKGNWVEENENLTEDNSDTGREQAIQYLMSVTNLTREQAEKHIDELITAAEKQRRGSYAEEHREELEKEWISTHTNEDGSVDWNGWEDFVEQKMNESEDLEEQENHSESKELTEDTVPASVLDFKHTELKKVQDNISLIASLKSEDPSNKLYTDLLDAYDKVQKALEDVIEEDPVGTVVDGAPGTEATPEEPIEEPETSDETIEEPAEEILSEPEEEIED